MLSSEHSEKRSSPVPCPVCKTSLTQDRYKKAISALQKTLLRTYQERHREERQKYRTKLAELKALHKSQVRSKIIQEKNRRKALDKKYIEQIRKERKKSRLDLRQVKRRYQMQAEQLRTMNYDQAANLQAQLNSEHSSELLKLTKRYEELAENIGKKFEEFNATISSELQNRSKTTSVVDQNRFDTAIIEPGGAIIPTGKREDIDEKRLEIERLKKIREIGEMIKEIAAQRHET